MKYSLIVIMSLMLNSMAWSLSTLSRDTSFYLYINIGNCVNCNANLTKLINSLDSIKNYQYFYVIEQNYEGKGDELLSELLNRRIDSRYIVYNDSLIQSISKKSGFKTWVYYGTLRFSVVYDISKIAEFNVNELSDANNCYSRKDYLTNVTLSNQLYFTIIENDTFVIDLVLSKIYRNGELIFHNLYVWDIPGFNKAALIGIDSVNAIYKIQFDNIVKVNNEYLIFCTGNQFVQNGNNVDVHPRTLILCYKADNFNQIDSFKSIIIEDSDNCYFDDYSIFKIRNNYYIISECGNEKLLPKVSRIGIKDDGVVLGKPVKLKIPIQQRTSKGYTFDLGNDIIYFIYSNKVQIIREKEWAIIDLYDFTSEIENDDYILAATNSGAPDNKILLSKGNKYILKNNFMDYRTSIANVLPYYISINKSELGQCVSNCFYSNISNKFIFINSKGNLIEIKLL